MHLNFYGISYTEPLLSILLAVSAAGLLRIRPPRGRIFLAIGILGLFLLSWPPAEWLFSRPLESPYHARPFEKNPLPQAIVVLGGGASPPQFERPYALANLDTLQRCAMAVWIYKQIGPLPVLGSEGSHGRHVFPSVMRELLRSGGIPDDLIWIEDRSHNTHENAMYSSIILQSRGIRQIALVTDAQSMTRATGCFRKLGIAVRPAPSEFAQLEFSLDDLLPNWKAVRRNERTLHEVLGLAWYSWKGWV